MEPGTVDEATEDDNKGEVVPTYPDQQFPDNTED